MSERTGAQVVESVAAAFERTFGAPPQGVWSAPGRVNLIGEHTDYNEGFVLPFALSEWVVVAGGAREDDGWRVRSLNRAALALFLQTVEAQRAFRITLIADVAEAYLVDRELAERIALADAATVGIYLCHMIHRQTDWSLRHDDAATVARASTNSWSSAAKTEFKVVTCAG